MIKYYSLIVFILIILSSCTQNAEKNRVSYSTNSDSTLINYNKGWEQIMDFGDYTAAERSYRKALTYDTDFLIGKSVLARLTLDLQERLALYELLENRKHEIKDDERLYLMFILL